jgi:hypothetical protein
MLKSVIILGGLLAPVFADGAFAQGGADLSGQWTVTWDNNSQNAMSVALTGDRFSGNYINDAKESCPVTGNLDTESSRLALQIVCPSWDIRMQGRASSDGKVIEGNYQAYIDATGTFTMSKQ